MAHGTALVAGAAGIIGDAVMRELDGAGWRVRDCRAAPLRDHPSIRADLTDPDATAAAVREASDPRAIVAYAYCSARLRPGEPLRFAHDRLLSKQC